MTRHANMHTSPLSNVLFVLSLSALLNLDLASASPLCSTTSSVSFLTPRTMSILGIQRECLDNAAREQSARRSLMRRAIDYLVPSTIITEPIADEGELYGRDLMKGMKEGRDVEGRPHNPMVDGAAEEGMQEPFELFESLVDTLNDKASGDVEKEGDQQVDYQDDARIAGLSISQPFTRPPCRHTPSPSLGAKSHKFVRDSWRSFKRRTRAMCTALRSLNLAVMLVIAVGVVVLVLLAAEAALGMRRLRASRSMARRGLDGRWERRRGDRRRCVTTILCDLNYELTREQILLQIFINDTRARGEDTLSGSDKT